MKNLLKKLLDIVFGSGSSAREREEILKFFIKWTFVGFWGRTLLALAGRKVNRDGWEDRILVIGPGGIGDIIMETPALRAYRRHFPGKRIYFLMVDHGGMERSVFDGLADVVLTFNGPRFEASPWYKVQIINHLRRIGFSLVVNDAAGLKDIASKVISISLGAEVVVGYEGPGVELVNPLSAPFLDFSKKHIFPRYTTLVPSIDKDFKERKTHPTCAILHHLAIATAVTGEASFPDVSTVFHVDTGAERSAREKLKNLGFGGGKYAVFVLACVDPGRRWEIEKYAEVADFVRERGFSIVVIGTLSQRAFSGTFQEYYSAPFTNAAGELTLLETAAVIKNAFCIFTNDTGPVHIAVALGTPSICIPAGAHLFMNSLYGREKINRWVFKDIGCLYDDARCYTSVLRGAAAPCVQAVSAGDVIKEFVSLEGYLAGHPLRDEPFVAGFEEESVS